MHTRAKAEFLQTFQDSILAPRNMSYRLQFTGPTGTNAVEAALKLARKITGRNNILAFTNGFHGVTLGAVAATGNQHHRGGAGTPLSGISRMPFCGYHGRDVDTLKMIDKMLSDPSSGIDKPAAAIIETVQGEGGLNVATDSWLRGLEKLCRKHGILLIVDDIQAGCGRTGSFFSFEPSGIRPDMVTLSKSLSGYGLPMALVLLRPDLDQWKPGEHNGTFRGNNHAFVTATAAIKHYWQDDRFARDVQAKGRIISDALKGIADKLGATVARPKGRSMMQGLELRDGETASKVSASAFEKGLVIETSGNRGQVVKILVSLTIDEADLREGLAILRESVLEVLEETLSQAS
ncbi:MAG TPA: aspartate aminotransferase family protein, partial [Spongiibacteraceae bacterium]|nr:aspartate aminotransferase family protein [Spongiibacteraceae bacterium]